MAGTQKYLMPSKNMKISGFTEIYLFRILLIPHNNTPTPIKKIPNLIGPDHQNTTNKSSMLKFSFGEFYLRRAGERAMLEDYVGVSG
jgi:hypothetical protein